MIAIRGLAQVFRSVHHRASFSCAGGGGSAYFLPKLCGRTSVQNTLYVFCTHALLRMVFSRNHHFVATELAQNISTQNWFFSKTGFALNGFSQNELAQMGFTQNHYFVSCEGRLRQHCIIMTCIMTSIADVYIMMYTSFLSKSFLSKSFEQV
jgi:hypothetical protein